MLSERKKKRQETMAKKVRVPPRHKHAPSHKYPATTQAQVTDVATFEKVNNGVCLLFCDIDFKPLNEKFFRKYSHDSVLDGRIVRIVPDSTATILVWR